MSRPSTHRRRRYGLLTTAALRRLPPTLPRPCATSRR